MMTFEESIEKIDRIMHIYVSEIAMLRDHLSRLRTSHAELLAVAKEAKETIRLWHGMNTPTGDERGLWELYQSSPEMRRINAAIARAEEPAP